MSDMTGHVSCQLLAAVECSGALLVIASHMTGHVSCQLPAADSCRMFRYTAGVGYSHMSDMTGHASCPLPAAVECSGTLLV